MQIVVYTMLVLLMTFSWVCFLLTVVLE